MSEQIKEEELNSLREFKEKAESKRIEALLVSLEAKATRLEYQNVVLKTYIEYGLSLEDHIDESTGTIVRKKDDESTENKVDEGTV